MNTPLTFDPKSGDIQGGRAPLFLSKMETYGNLVDADIS